MTQPSIGFRRICTTCRRTVTWNSPGDLDLEGDFLHLEDRSPLCDGGNVDLEIKEHV